MKITKKLLEIILSRFKAAWQATPGPRESAEFSHRVMEQVEKLPAASADTDPLHRIERKFAHALRHEPVLSDSREFQLSVMNAVAQEKITSTEKLGITAVEQRFRAALLRSPDPAPSPDFAFRVMAAIRTQNARIEEEESLLDSVLGLSEQLGIAICTLSVLFAFVTISQVSLLPDLPVDSLINFVG